MPGLVSLGAGHGSRGWCPDVQGFSEGKVHSDALEKHLQDVSSWGPGEGKETMERGST